MLWSIERYLFEYHVTGESDHSAYLLDFNFIILDRWS